MNAYVLQAGCEQTRPEWAAPIASRLEEVEGKLKSTVSSDVPAACELSIHLFSAGGKRIRPAIALLSALAVDPDTNSDRLINFAAATELVHMASLVHDDVVDETAERRGKATANTVWGNKLSVLGGDFLLSKAFSLLASDGDPEIIRVLSATAVNMTESEILQAASEGSLPAWRANYWKIIRGKTAGFMSACCECGAIIAGADSSLRSALAEYGVQLGYAFQITDDLLDIAGDPAVTGKDIGTDLMNGKFTLPVLLAIEDTDPEERRIILATLDNGPLTRQQARDLAERLISTGALDRARASATDMEFKARAALAPLPVSMYRTAMENLARSVTDRNV